MFLSQRQEIFQSQLNQIPIFLNNEGKIGRYEEVLIGFSAHKLYVNGYNVSEIDGVEFFLGNPLYRRVLFSGKTWVLFFTTSFQRLEKGTSAEHTFLLDDEEAK